jgi:hypothetical protein
MLYYSYMLLFEELCCLCYVMFLCGIMLYYVVPVYREVWWKLSRNCARATPSCSVTYHAYYKDACSNEIEMFALNDTAHIIIGLGYLLLFIYLLDIYIY